MPITVTYTGALGPASIVCGGILFKKNVPVVVDQDAMAEKLLAKSYFKRTPETAKPDVVTNESPAATGTTGRKEKEK